MTGEVVSLTEQRALRRGTLVSPDAVAIEICQPCARCGGRIIGMAHFIVGEGLTCADCPPGPAA